MRSVELEVVLGRRQRQPRRLHPVARLWSWLFVHDNVLVYEVDVLFSWRRLSGLVLRRGRALSHLSDPLLQAVSIAHFGLHVAHLRLQVVDSRVHASEPSVFVVDFL